MYIRGKGYYNSTYNIEDLHQFYKQKSTKPVDRVLYNKVIKRYFDLVMPNLINGTLKELRLPGRLGYLSIRSREYKITFDADGNLNKGRLAPDWGKTLKLWKKQYPDKTPEEMKGIPNKKLIYLLNEHTDKRILIWYWDKTMSTVLNQSYYQLKIGRSWSRSLAKYNKENFINYHTYEP